MEDNYNKGKAFNENLLDKVYLPDVDRKNFINGKAFKLLKENNNDTTVLEGYAEKSKEPLKFEDFNTYQDKEEWIAKHAGPEEQKQFFSALGDFVLDLGKDGIRSLAVGATNGVDFAVNLAPVLTKLYDLAPAPIGGGGTLEASGVQEDIVSKANKVSDNLGEAREFLKNYKDDGNVVSKLIQVMGQDLMYSVPIYNKLKSAGMPTVPAFVISGGVGGAIGIEKKLKFTGNDQEQYNSSFIQDFFGRDIAEFKRLIGILPDTPYDEIADEVVQSLEYGTFSYAIPKVIQGLQFMKKNIPYFAGGGAALTLSGDDAEASPIKAITNAVFKSTAKEAVEQKITKGSGPQIFNTIKNTPGVKESELKWIGLESFLKDKKNVTQQEVLDFIEANRVDINEVEFPRKDKSFGMYNDMLEGAEQRKIDWSNSRRNLRGGDQRTNFDNIYLSVGDENRKFKNERISFALFSETPTGRVIRGFNDVNTFNVDVDAIKKQFPGEDLNHVEFYEVRDTISNTDIAISKSQYNDPDYNPLFNTSNKRYKLDFINQMSHDELEKFSLESEIRDLSRARNKQEGTTRYETYTERGGDDYKELIFKFKQKGPLGGDKPIPVSTDVTKFDDVDSFGIDESPHFHEMGELAHVRFKTRFLNDERKVLSVEEMQSDLVQQVKEFNQSNPSVDPEITDFPFKNNWYELTLKRLIRYAADNGFDAISIPKGRVVKDRYNLAYYVDELQIGSYDPKNGYIGLEGYEFGDTRKILTLSDNFTFEEARKRFGEDLYNRIIQKAESMTPADFDAGNNTMSFNKQLAFGGEGKDKLYDKTIPSFLKKYGKKWNAKVYDDEVTAFFTKGQDIAKYEGNTKIPVTVIDVTPEMKKSVQSTPQPLFELFGGVSVGTLGAQAVSDSIENNIISQTTN